MQDFDGEEAMSETIEKFEDFVAWKKARQLISEIYRVTDSGRFGRVFALRDQIRRAAVSIMSNIAEGFERGKPSEFHGMDRRIRLPIFRCASLPGSPRGHLHGF